MESRYGGGESKGGYKLNDPQREWNDPQNSCTEPCFRGPVQLGGGGLSFERFCYPLENSYLSNGV